MTNRDEQSITNGFIVDLKNFRNIIIIKFYEFAYYVVGDS